MLDSSKQINNTLINQQNWEVTLSPPGPENQKTFTRKSLALAIKSPQGTLQKQETESKARQKWIYNKWGIIVLSLRKEKTVMEGNKLRKTNTWIKDINLAEWPFPCSSFHQCHAEVMGAMESWTSTVVWVGRDRIRDHTIIKVGKSPKTTVDCFGHQPVTSVHLVTQSRAECHIQVFVKHFRDGDSTTNSLDSPVQDLKDDLIPPPCRGPGCSSPHGLRQWPSRDTPLFPFRRGQCHRALRWWLDRGKVERKRFWGCFGLEKMDPQWSGQGRSQVGKDAN